VSTADTQEQRLGAVAAPAFRLDPEHHQDLMRPVTRPVLETAGEPQTLPEPVYPRHPGRREAAGLRLTYHLRSGSRALRCWVAPYLKSRLLPGQFRPLLAFFFTDYACNLDCQYCWAHDSGKGMSEDTARRAIDWLHSVDCRVLALMGGEPLVRPRFVHQVVDYGVRRGFFVYVPTNGRKMTPEVIDRLGDAGVAVINLAVDCVTERPGLPKALEHIRPQFDYLVRMQTRYGYMIVLNINICHNNLDDVKELTEIGYANGISSDYHINEEPLMEHASFTHLAGNHTFLTPEDYPRVDALLDYLVARTRRGYLMVNSKKHLADMKAFMRGAVDPWPCRAGQSTLIIRTDGSLAPCFAMDSATHDWGTVENPKFEIEQLDAMKRACNTRCLSTCNYVAGHYYSGSRWILWALKNLVHGYQGVRGDGHPNR
jgi:MoaA/NifB/PqqE/SkfB family radical SAM enzyme